MKLIGRPNGEAKDALEKKKACKQTGVTLADPFRLSGQLARVKWPAGTRPQQMAQVVFWEAHPEIYGKGGHIRIEF